MYLHEIWGCEYGWWEPHYTVSYVEAYQVYLPQFETKDGKTVMTIVVDEQAMELDDPLETEADLRKYCDRKADNLFDDCDGHFTDSYVDYFFDKVKEEGSIKTYCINGEMVTFDCENECIFEVMSEKTCKFLIDHLSDWLFDNAD